MDHAPEEEKKKKQTKKLRPLTMVLIVGAVFVGVGFLLGGTLGQPKVPSKDAVVSTNSQWKGVSIGTATTDDLVHTLGQPLKTAVTQSGTTYYYTGQDSGWPTEVSVNKNAVSFTKEHLFYPSNSFSTVGAGISSSPTLFYSKSNRSGNTLYVYRDEGIAIYGNKEQNLASEVFHFSSATEGIFMSYLSSEGYSNQPPKEEGLGF